MLSRNFKGFMMNDYAKELTKIISKTEPLKIDIINIQDFIDDFNLEDVAVIDASALLKSIFEIYDEPSIEKKELSGGWIEYHINSDYYVLYNTAFEKVLIFSLYDSQVSWIPFDGYYAAMGDDAVVFIQLNGYEIRTSYKKLY